MRQAGMIAAAGLYALKKNLPLLVQDHQRAAELARGLGGIEGLILEYEKPPTNMVYINLAGELLLNAEETALKLKERGVLVGVTGERQFRMVVHIWIDDQDVEKVIRAFKDVLS